MVCRDACILGEKGLNIPIKMLSEGALMLSESIFVYAKKSCRTIARQDLRWDYRNLWIYLFTLNAAIPGYTALAPSSSSILSS